jgi:hypothetical protein
MIRNPSRPGARDTAASCMTTLAQSRPDSDVAITPRIYLSARRNHFTTSRTASSPSVCYEPMAAA